MHEVYQSSMTNHDHTNANRALEGIGKHLGMFVEGTHMRYWMKPVYEVKFGFKYLFF